MKRMLIGFALLVTLAGYALLRRPAASVAPAFSVITVTTTVD